ncbi:hypothetical protein Ddc_16941 [Ditylenchus destructor]|nr:hypothetical protein Ddc_16941 [Ditylenchus destructor]
MEAFISRQPLDEPYKPGVFEKIFTSKGGEHNEAKLLFLLLIIDLVSAILCMMKQHCDSKWLLTSGYHEIHFVKSLTDLLADDFCYLALKNIDGTIIFNHQCCETIDRHEAMETFIARRPFDQLYNPQGLLTIGNSASDTVFI